MTTGSQLAVTGREGRAAPSWAAWRSQAAPDPWPVTVETRLPADSPWLGRLGRELGRPAAAGVRPARLKLVRGLWKRTGLCSRAKRGSSNLG